MFLFHFALFYVLTFLKKKEDISYVFLLHGIAFTLYFGVSSFGWTIRVQFHLVFTGLLTVWSESGRLAFVRLG